MRLAQVFPVLPLVLAAPLLLTPASLALAQPAPPSERALPALGDGEDMGLSEERRLGDQIARAIYRDPDYLDDPALSAYLDSLWQPLLAAARHRGEIAPDLAERFAWEVLLARDRSINAFALPGGYLGVHLGLIASVTTPDELASVLAHELSHISQRHIARMVSRQSQQTPWLLAAMILGALAASAASNADIAGAAIVGGQAVAAQTQLNFSRDMEREADRVGFSVMTDAGFDGRGFVTMFDKLQQASRLNDNGSYPYLRSHPLTSQRISDMQARLPAHGEAAPDGHPRGAAGAPSLVHHALMSARARVVAEPDMDRLRNLAQTGRGAARSPLNDPATLGQRYAGALASARLREGPQALDTLAALKKALPNDDAAHQDVRWLELEVRALLQPAQGATDPELTTLRDQALASDRREAFLLGARTAVTGSATSQRLAVQKLQSWTTLHPRDALAWQVLATLHTAEQQPVRAARAEAEARLAQLDLQGALDRFRSARLLAQKDGRLDHFELSILDARMRQVESMMREQAREDDPHHRG